MIVLFFMAAAGVAVAGAAGWFLASLIMLLGTVDVPLRVLGAVLSAMVFSFALARTTVPVSDRNIVTIVLASAFYAGGTVATSHHAFVQSHGPGWLGFLVAGVVVVLGLAGAEQKRQKARRKMEKYRREEERRMRLAAERMIDDRVRMQRAVASAMVPILAAIMDQHDGRAAATPPADGRPVPPREGRHRKPSDPTV